MIATSNKSQLRLIPLVDDDDDDDGVVVAGLEACLVVESNDATDDVDVE